MILGFTGTRKGLTPPQTKALLSALLDQPPSAAHHGCAVGADAEFALAVAHIFDHAKPRVLIVGWPSNVAGQVDERAMKCCDQVHDCRAPLERNRCIVDACERLIACPAGMAEEQRSGTWATVRYARKVGKPVTIVWPDGSVQS